MPQIKALQAWEKTTGSGQIVVAVIDTGVDINHPDLVNNIWRNSGEIPDDGIDNDGNGYIDDINGWNWIDDDNDPTPEIVDGYSIESIHHGTMIAGLIAAEANNGQGIAGVAWKTKIMALRGLSSMGQGSTTMVAEAIDYAVDNGADIINLSMVTPTDAGLFYQAIKRAYDNGVMIIAAAGNEPDKEHGENLNDDPLYPACYSHEVLTVAATDTLDQRADFSNYGSDCVDLSAPGVGIFSTLFQSPTLILGFGVNTMQFEDYYAGGYAGTSFSTPLVSGAAALVKSVKPSLTNQEIYDILIESADPIEDLNPNFRGQLGSGRLNIAKAIDTALSYSSTGGSEGYFSSNVQLFLTTQGKGNSEIYLYNKDGQVINQFLASTDQTTNGLFLTTADLDQDGSNEVIVAPGPGMPGYIRVFDQQGNLKNIFTAMSEYYQGGWTIAIGDVNRDGQLEIILGSVNNDESWVRITDLQGNPLYLFSPYEGKDNIGVNVAVGDIDGDGYDDIVTAPRAGNYPIKVFDDKGNLKSQFYAYNQSFKAGINLAVGNVDNDPLAEIVVAPLNNGGPHVKVFEYTGLLKSQFFAYNSFFYGGVSLAIGDFDLDNQPEIITAAGPGGGPHVRAFSKTGELKSEFFAFDAQMSKGLRIASN